MFSGLLALFNLLYFALHISGGTPNAFLKPFTPKEEQACIAKIRQGDEQAKNSLIEHNLRLVAHIVKKYYASTVEQDDLLSIGTIGLIKAASTFDYDKGTRFATYAARCIENEILMYFRRKKKNAQDVYISDPIDTDGEGKSLTLMDILADERSIYESIEAKFNCEQLYRLMNTCLDDREREILYLRYGLGGTRSYTQREVASRLGISRSYISRIEKKALEKLKSKFDSVEEKVQEKSPSVQRTPLK